MPSRQSYRQCFPVFVFSHHTFEIYMIKEANGSRTLITFVWASCALSDSRATWGNLFLGALGKTSQTQAQAALLRLPTQEWGGSEQINMQRVQGECPDHYGGNHKTCIFTGAIQRTTQLLPRTIAPVYYELRWGIPH